ncbi:hypothetical protein SKAU_G00044410 [Synaphobranchus kaupii]|uniref:Uncharacterized protein n=1 Tax=Synaphobranchus kaupii TaxID=118154 RepID=A0A9Q1J821_SYNKA|nr:hypothetical protein SKAU_G00044410 [Synaphobranchus kaupii]
MDGMKIHQGSKNTKSTLPVWCLYVLVVWSSGTVNMQLSFRVDFWVDTEEGWISQHREPVLLPLTPSPQSLPGPEALAAGLNWGITSSFSRLFRQAQREALKLWAV